MIYRASRPSDRIDIRKMCKDEGLHFDEREELFGVVAEDDLERQDDSRLVGFSMVHKAAIIDPFICRNELAALKLFYMTEGAIMMTGLPVIVVQVNSANEKLLKELPRLGFAPTESNYVVYKKV
jgi:hypothetical protein